MDVRLIAIDLDDTLLRKDLSISPRSIDCIRALSERGIKIVISSGRAPESVRDYAERLGLHRTRSFLICHNGSLALTSDTHRIVCEHRLDADLSTELFRRIERTDLPCHVYEDGMLFASKESSFSDAFSRITGKKVILPVSFDAFVRQGHFKLVVPGDPDFLADLVVAFQREFSGRATVFISKPYFLEILPFGVGKGESLKEIAEHRLGLNRDQVMAFGDSMNDESMIRYAGESVAMCNGRAEIIALAKHVTGKSNEDDGIADFLERTLPNLFTGAAQ